MEGLLSMGPTSSNFDILYDLKCPKPSQTICDWRCCKAGEEVADMENVNSFTLGCFFHSKVLPGSA